MSQPVFSTGLDEDLVQRVGTKLHLEVTVEDQSEKVFFEWRGPAGSNADDGRIVITETGNTSTAEITPLHLQDQGIWTCSAKNKHGVTQTKTNVLAQVPKSYKAPVFLEELVAGLTDQGTVSLECKVVGIPSPALRWFRDGDEIRSGDVFALQANMERPVSVYRCDAVNCMGTVSSTAVLDVSKSLSSQTKSAPVLTETLIDKKVKIGELVELSIAVSRVSLPVRVVWWNHGSQIAVGEKYSVVENAEGRYSVIINPVELCDDGEWKVSIENQFGSASSECTLTLRVPKNYRKPRFVENLKAVLTKEGLVSFECKVVGYPTPVLRWFKDGAELKPGDVYQLSGSRSLGTYSCLARNCMGEAVSTAALTVEDIGEKFPDSKSELRFLVPLQDASVKIGDKHRFSIQVTYSPCLEIAWRHKEVTVGNNERVTLSKEDGGFYHCDINQSLLEDEGEWSVIAKDSGHEIDTKCLLSVTVPKHYKKPRFLEPLKAVLTEEGAVNLECKVIGVPQPTLSWYKDGVELKAGDIHRLMSGKDGSCCLGTYTCVATNCMGSVTSSAALLGFEDAHEQEHAIAHDLQTPDISDGNLKPFSLSTIQEERTSQMMSPEAAQITETLRQQSLDNDDQISIISMGKLDQDGELSLSIGNQEVTLSLYQTPDLSEGDAKNICEMFAEELAESITESNYVELPPLRFTKETAKASNISMEAIIIDIDQQDLEEYESMKMALENIDDLQTECDIEDVSVAEWNEDPVRGTEFETLTCEEILEFDDVAIKCEPVAEAEQYVDETISRLQNNQIIKQEIVLSQTEEEIQLIQDISQSTKIESSNEKEDELDKVKILASTVEIDQTSIVLSENKSDAITSKPTEKLSKVVGVQKKTEKSKSKDEIVEFDISWRGSGESVMVAGDFNNWQPQELTQGEKGVWSITKKLSVGKFNIKFVVDGKWVISENLASITDSEGNLNNQIDVMAHGKKQESTSVELRQSTDKCKHEDTTSDDSNLELKETDTIKRASKAKSKEEKATKVTDDKNEQIKLKVESSASISSVTETEKTVLSGESQEKQASTGEIKLQKENEETVIKKNSEANEKEDIKNKALKEDLITPALKLSEKDEKTQETKESKTMKSYDKVTEIEGQTKDSKEHEIKVSQQKETSELEDLKSSFETAITEENKQNLDRAEKEIELLPSVPEGKVLVPSDVRLQGDTIEIEKETVIAGENIPVQKEVLEEREPMGEDSTNVLRQKKQSRQESVVDSESLPDIETYDVKENIFLTQENKDLLSNDDDLDLDEDFEAFKKERRKSSYEETLAGMDPEILKELGLAPTTEEDTVQTEKLDLSLLPTETTEERMSRIEEKANKMVIEDDSAARKSRSRSRSRSKSRPPNLDTVLEQKKEEILEARFYGLQPSLDTIKESPSTASMLGVLQGGFSSASVNTVLQGGISSASVNTVLQGSPSTSSLHKDLTDQSQASPLPKEKVEHRTTMSKGRISEEKDIDDIDDDKLSIQDSATTLKEEQTIVNPESKSKDNLGTDKIQSLDQDPEKIDPKSKEQVSDETSKTSKKPKKKAQRSDTKLIKLEVEEKSRDSEESLERKYVGSEENDKAQIQLKQKTTEDKTRPTEEQFSSKSVKDEQNKLTKEKASEGKKDEQELIKDKMEEEQAGSNVADIKAVEVDKEKLKDVEEEKAKQKDTKVEIKKATKEMVEGKLSEEQSKEDSIQESQKISEKTETKSEEEGESKLSDKKQDCVEKKVDQLDQKHLVKNEAKNMPETEKKRNTLEDKSLEEINMEDKKIQSGQKSTEERNKVEELKTKLSVDLKENKLSEQTDTEEEVKNKRLGEQKQMEEEVHENKSLEKVEKNIPDEQVQKDIEKASMQLEENTMQIKDETNVVAKPKDALMVSKFVPGYIEKQDSLELFEIDNKESLEVKKSLEEVKENKRDGEKKEEEMKEEKEKKIAEEQRNREIAKEERIKKEQEEKERKRREEEEKKKSAEEELVKIKAKEEDEKRKLAEKEQNKKEEEERIKAEAEFSENKAKEEDEKKKAAEEGNKKKAAEIELAKNKAKEEEKKRKEAEEEQKKQAKEEEQKKKAAENEKEKRAKEEEEKRKEAESEERKKAKEEKQMKKAAEEEKEKRDKEEEIKKKAAEEELAKKKEEEEKKKSAAEELAKKKAIEEEKKRKVAEEEKKIMQEKEEEERKRAEAVKVAEKKAKEDEEKMKKAKKEEERKKVEEELAKIKAKEEEEKKKVAEEEKQKRAKEEEQKKTAAKKAAEEEQKKKAAEEEQKKKAAEEEFAKKKLKEEEENRRVAENEKKKKSAEEEQKREAAEEEQRKKAAEEELAKKKAKEQEDQKKAAEVEENKKAAEEELAKKKAKEEEVKKIAAESVKQQRAKEEEEKKRAAEEEEKRAAEEDQKKKAAEEEEKKKAAKEEEKKRKAEEELAKKKAIEEEEKKIAAEAVKQQKANEEQQKKKAAEEEQKKRAAEEDLKKKAAEEEQKKKAAKEVQEEEENKKAAQEKIAQKKVKEEEEKRKSTGEELARKKAKENEEKIKAAEEEKNKWSKQEEEKKKAAQEELANADKKRAKNIDNKNAQEEQTKRAENAVVKKRKDGKKVKTEEEIISENDKRKSLSVSEIFEESSSEDLITVTDDIPSTREISRINAAKTPQRMSTSKSADNEKNKGSAYMHDNITLEKTSYQADSYSTERAGKYEAESRKRSGIGTHYSTQDSDRSGADYSSSRYKNVVSPVMDHYKAKDSNESYSSSSHRDVYRDYNVQSHKPPTPDIHRYDNLSVSKDVRDSRLSPTYDSRTRNISGDVHYRDTVEKSMQTSQNLMSVVTGSLIQKQEQPKTRPTSTATKQATKKVSNEESKEAALRKKLELEKNGVAGAVTDIMIKEVGSSWVSLCWKKPSVSRESPVITYKVETWLCGEGAFWVELGRTPIPQFDAFNLKANKCYHFRVTARNKRGWGDAIMTTHKVDLSKPTQMPVITSDMDPIIKALKDSSVRLSIQVSGEPAPKVTWQKDSVDATTIPGVTVFEDDMGSHVEISGLNMETTGKYTVTAANLAGRTTKSVLVQSVENIEVYDAYKKFKKWQGLVHSPLAPFMINGPRDRRIQVGQSIQLTCRVISNPWPVVKWFKEDEPIIPDDYTNIYNEADFQHVQVDDVTLDHCGKYCVEAFNEHGSIRSHFTVIVDNGLDRYMPPFFTKELKDTVIMQGCNLLLHCRVESYPYIGVTWHQSGSKIRLKETDYKLIDDDGNVVLVLFEVQRSHNFNCTIMNEIAENSTACKVVVNAPNQPLVQIDEDVIRHSMGPRFVSWPTNQEVVEGSTVTVECSVENCSTLIMSRDFLPKSIDGSVIKFNKLSGNTWSATISDISTDSSGLYFITARNSSSEDKYPIIIKVKSNIDLTEVTECALDDGVGAPSLSEIGPVFARDGDDVIIKTNIRNGQAPFAVSWTLNGKDIVWSNRVSPYNRPGCIGIKILRAGTDDEGRFKCNVQNSIGQANFNATLLVDYAEQKESELMEELCNCPMLDAITPLMSWGNTPIGTPRRTPLPTPHATPLLTPRATPGTTPRATPRATPSRGTPSLPRRSYGHGDIRSPSRGSNYGDEMMVPPPRRRFVQAPEIFSSFSSKQVDEGASVELKCFISCAPLTQTTWEKDHLPLVSNNQIILSEKTGVRTLTIHNAKLGDSGSYRMTITNSSGSTSCTAILTVKKKNTGSNRYYASSQLSVPRSPYSSLGRSSLGRSSSSYSSYSSYRSYL